jgi:hypothetical protein
VFSLRPVHRIRTAILATALVIATSITPAMVSRAAATIPLVDLTITVAPNPAAPYSAHTFIGTITPTSGIPTDVRVHMEFSSSLLDGECDPACTYESGNPTWTWPSLNSKVTVAFTTSAIPYQSARLFFESDGWGCRGECPVSVTPDLPTVKAGATSLSGGSVVSGGTLRISVGASANAAPIDGALQVALPAGVGPPSNLSADADYRPPPYHDITRYVRLDGSSVSLSFDVVVSVANGSTITFQPTFSTRPGVAVVTKALSVWVGRDTTAPTTTTPKHRLVVGGAPTSGRVPVKLSWTGSDAMSGIARYHLSQSTDGGSWTTVSTSLTTRTLSRPFAHGHTYRLRVRAVDRAGNVGAWKYGSTFRVTRYHEGSAKLRYGRTWRTSTSTLWWGGKARYSSQAGATAKITFTGRSFAWLGLRSSKRGKAKVYVNGSYVATVDLFATTTQARRLVWARNWASTGTRTVVIKVLGTSGRPRIDVDAFLILR